MSFIGNLSNRTVVVYGGENDRHDDVVVFEVNQDDCLFVNYHDHRAQLPAFLISSHARPSQRKANAWKVTPIWDVLCVTLHMLCDL